MSTYFNPFDLSNPNFNELTPPAPAGKMNAQVQADQSIPNRNFSFNVPNFGGSNKIAGTTYTIQESDQGKILVFTNAAAVAVTLPVFPNGAITAMQVRSGGTGWNVADKFFILQGGFTVVGEGEVTSVNSGIVTGVSIFIAGAGYSSQFGVSTQATGGATGINLLVDITAPALNFVCWVMVLGAGGATFTPASGDVNNIASVSAAQNNGGSLWWDGKTWWAEGGGLAGGGGGSGVTILVNGL